MSHAYIKLKTRSGIANQCVMFVIKIYIFCLKSNCKKEADTSLTMSNQVKGVLNASNIKQKCLCSFRVKVFFFNVSKLSVLLGMFVNFVLVE